MLVRPIGRALGFDDRTQFSEPSAQQFGAELPKFLFGDLTR
jgi:hypothetical protein